VDFTTRQGEKQRKKKGKEEFGGSVGKIKVERRRRSSSWGGIVEGNPRRSLEDIKKRVIGGCLERQGKLRWKEGGPRIGESKKFVIGGGGQGGFCPDAQ